MFVINQLAFFIAAAAGYRRYGAETTEEIILKPLNPLSCRISYNKKRTRIAQISRIEGLYIREICVIRVRFSLLSNIIMCSFISLLSAVCAQTQLLYPRRAANPPS